MTKQTVQAQEFPLPGRYRHYKGGDYDVIGTARHSETDEMLVVYRCLYDDHSLWVRPLSMFMESVERGGESIARFRYIGPSGDLEAEISEDEW